jgi:GalNAc-alpha-(1->4)-GalNAc-alpha-(1->3)-diNAcBac-PP-undecaprenol alpha-1,4-N-acetyl-D-galactosaminyltransferase
MLENQYRKDKELKKVLFVIGTLGYGGAERVLVTLANNLASNSIQVEIITITNNKESAYPLNKNVKHSSIDISNSALKRKISQILNLRKKIKQQNPDIVISFLSIVNITVIAAMLGLKIPLIVSERNDPKIDPQFFLQRIVRFFLYPLADGFVFQTEKAKEFFSSSIQHRSIVIPNPIVEKDFPKLWNGDRRKEIVTVGRLVEQKNHKLLIKAFSKVLLDFPDYKLILYGDGQLKTALNLYIKELDLENRVVLAGNKENVLDYINGASIFVLSSNFEGMPNSLIEAMALGLPCISTNCSSGGPEYLIENNKSGFLVPVNSEIELERAMKLLIGNPEIATEFSRNAIKVKSKLNEKKIIEKWGNYIEGLLLH